MVDGLEVGHEGEESRVMGRGGTLLFGKYFSSKMMRGNCMGDILR